jgi:acetyl esterase/lipase
MMPTPTVSGSAHRVQVVSLRTGVDVRVHRPSQETSDAGPALLWIHGGGYVLGHAAMDDRHCRRLADALGATVAAVDYRLAPAHPHPVALHDCYDALTWLVERGSVDRARVAVAGASAGGGLAASLAQLTHDRAEFSLAAQVLVHPMLDDRTGHRPDPNPRHRRMWNNTSNRFGWTSYLGAADPQSAVPARRRELSGLPPAWIGVGTLDILHDEAVGYAERLRAAGVGCHLEVVSGAFHGFDAVAPKTQVAQAFFASQLSALRRAYA